MSRGLTRATLIPAEALLGDGPAKDRALAYLAHGEGALQVCPMFGELFGTIYDLSTVLILSFAGASAMAAMGIAAISAFFIISSRVYAGR